MVSYTLQGSFETDGKEIKGFGATAEEAVDNLGTAIFGEYKFLRSKEYCLSGGGRAILKHLDDMFE